MAMTRNVGSEDADLAICNLAYRTSVLPRHTARRLALLEKAGLVDDEDRIVICQMLDDIVADNIAQGIGIPIPATKDRLLPPWTRIARRLGAHPTGLALLIAEQTFQKQACVPRNAFLPEQRTYPLLHFPKRRCPQCKRLFNRRCTRPRSSNHGCPWIQISSERATVMLRQSKSSAFEIPPKTQLKVFCIPQCIYRISLFGCIRAATLGRTISRTMRMPCASGGAAGHDPDGRKGIDRFTALIVGGPFDLRDPLRFGPRRSQFDHFALDVEHIALSHRYHPAQFVDAKANKWMRSERPDFNGKSHRHGGGVPPRCGA